MVFDKGGAEKLASWILSEKRFRHSAGVAEMGVKLAGLHGLDKDRVETAAWLHDLAREVPLDWQLELANRYQLIDYPEDEETPEVLHGRLAAFWLENHYAVNDPEVISAIANHTLGKPGMSKLELLIYSADKVEPNRSFPEVDILRQALYDNLEKGALACIEHSLKYLRAIGHQIHPLTYLTYEDLKGRMNI